MWHQAQMDAEARGLPPSPQPSFSPTPPSAPYSPPQPSFSPTPPSAPSSPPQPSFSPTPPSAPPSNPSSIEHGLAMDAQRPPYNPSLYELPSAPAEHHLLHEEGPGASRPDIHLPQDCQGQF